MVSLGSPIFVAEFEEERKTVCGKINYRTASFIVAALEVGYWFYYAILLGFAIVNHKMAWSIVVMSVNLTLLTVQILMVWLALVKRLPKLLQGHLVFLCLTLVWDLLLSLAFFVMAVFPGVFDGRIISYKGREWNARVFGAVMGSLLILWFAARFISTIIIYRYWKILRNRERQAREIPYRQAKVRFAGNDVEYELPAPAYSEK